MTQIPRREPSSPKYIGVSQRKAIFRIICGVSKLSRAIRSATRHHRAGFAVYAGFNGSVGVRGIQPPRRIQPSPLNLVIRHLDAAVDASQIVLDTFEFLDMDAY